nr:uncharacterized mitochondrial protein AtMg00810-like [Tanacetum cinerariifolium]
GRSTATPRSGGMGGRVGKGDRRTIEPVRRNNETIDELDSQGNDQVLRKIKVLVESLTSPQSLLNNYITYFPPSYPKMVVETKPATIKKSMKKAGTLKNKAIRNGSLKKNTEKRGNCGEPSRDRNVKNDNKRSRTGNAFATSANPVRREYTSTADKCTDCNLHHSLESPCRDCFSCNRLGHLAKDCRVVPRTVNLVNARNPTTARGACFECGGTDHFKAALPRLNQAQRPGGVCPNQVMAIDEGQGRGNNGNRARKGAFMLGVEEACQDPNIMMVNNVETVIPRTTTEEKLQRRNKVKARSTLMTGLPNEHQLKFNSFKDVKSLLERKGLVVNAASSLNIDNLSDAVIFAFLASQPNSTHLINEDLEQIHPDDLEEMVLKWQMAMLTTRARRFLKSLFPPLKLDLSYTRLEGLFNEPKNEKLKDKSNDVEPESIRKGSDAPIIVDWVSDDEEEKVEKREVKPKYEKFNGGYLPFEGILKEGRLQEKVQKQVMVQERREPKRDYILLPFWTADSPFFTTLKSSQDNEFQPSNDGAKKVDEDLRKENECNDQGGGDSTNNTNRVNTITSNINVASSSRVNVVGTNICIDLPPDPNIPSLEDIGIFEDSHNDEDVFGAEADFHNFDSTFQVSPIPTTRIYIDHPLEHVIGDFNPTPHTRRMTKNLEEHGFVDKVYKVEKKLYGLHQALKAWYETLSTYLLDNGFKRGQIDKTLFTKRNKGDILLVQVYVNDIIFGSTKKEMCDAFEILMHEKFQMSSMGEFTFFLGLQVKQKKEGIFISQDKYVAEILKKFGFSNVKKASTPMGSLKPLLIDEDGKKVDVHMYRSMIGSLMYLTSSRQDTMFVAYTYYCQKKVNAATHRLTTASDRHDLKCNDAEGTLCLSYDVIFEELARMSAKTTSWNEFSSNMASAIISLANNQKFNFSKYILTSLVKNLEADVPFYMFLRKHKPKRKQRMETEVSPTKTNIEEHVLTHSNDPLPSGEDRMQLKELIDLCTNLSNKVLDLENEIIEMKSSHKAKIKELESRVEKLEEENMPLTKELKSFNTRVESPAINETVMDKEESSRQERKIANSNADAEVNLENVYNLYMVLKETILSTQDVDIQSERIDSGVKEVAKEVVEVMKIAKIIVNEVSTAGGKLNATNEETISAAPTNITTTQPCEATKITFDFTTAPKAKGILFHDKEESTTRTASSILQAKDKGKAKLVKESKILKSRKAQIPLDEDVARRIETEWNADMKDNIDWNEVLEQVQSRQLDALRKYQSLKRKPMSLAQARKNMMIYLKNMAGFKMDFFKGMSYEEIRPLFEEENNYNNLNFLSITMSSPDHSISNNEDVFSSNIRDYVSNIPDYFPASSGKTYSNASNNSTGKIPLEFSPFYSMKDIQEFYAKELPIPSPDPITPSVILTPSPVLPPSLLFDP